ncbi:MAG: polysaccharide biosynthesis/export family protein [Pseudomonadota bacterium]|nr:polysaccharide biosynthesis/export family protein [Pseudomonadota bacterium]
MSSLFESRPMVPQLIKHIALLAVLCVGIVSSLPILAENDTRLTPDYLIAAEDVLDISVWREPDLQKQVIVRPDGGISMPLIGNVKAAGRTTAELETLLVTKLSTYIPDAVVTVSVVQLRGLRIYVTGQVRRPGQFEVGRYIDVLQAITLAGGFTAFANKNKVQIIRREDGRETVLKFNYKQVEKGRNLAQNIRLQTDDVVLVP